MLIDSLDPRDLQLANPPQEVFIPEPQEGQGIGIIRVPNGMIYKFFELTEIENEEGYEGESDNEYVLKSTTFVPIAPNFFRDYQEKNVEQKNQKNDKENSKKQATEPESTNKNKEPKGE